MRQPKRRLTRLLITIPFIIIGCTLDIDTPIQAPVDTWDPTLNTHSNGEKFQDLLNLYVVKGLPGVVLYVRSPQGKWNGAAGYAKIETDSPMLPTHLHHVASGTKMYTATATLLLTQDGVIDLDNRISQYLPESVYGNIPNGAEATIRQLLSHTSGIPDFSGDLSYDLDFLNDPLGSYPTDRLLSYLHGQSPLFSPGSGYFYSNANYLLAALVLDYAVEAGHASVISERILQPLNLNGTYYKNEPGYPTPPGLVNSYADFAGDGRLANVTDLITHAAKVFFGNAGLIATSADLAAFIEGLLGGQLIGATLLSEMQNWTESSRYGLGLNYIQTPYGLGIGHSGSDTGTRSQVRYFPTIDATLVLLVNGANSGVTSKLFDQLWDDIMLISLSEL